MASRDIDQIGIVGAGAMGAGIAQVALTGGLSVVLYDLDAAARARAAAGIGERLDRLAAKGQLDDPASAKARLTLAGDLADLAACPVVIEAVVENLAVKRELFTALEKIVSPYAVLASNTSSLPIGSIALACAHRERVVGLHFFNPVPLMRLVEVILPEGTRPGLGAELSALCRRMGRTPVEVKDTPGFLVNLGGRAFTQEALHLVAEGVAQPAEIDAVMRDAWGFRMGPFELMDLTGIDVNYPASRVIYEGFQDDPRLRTTALHRRLYEDGKFGRKTRQGFYAYAEDGGVVAAPAAAESTVPAPDPLIPDRVFLAEPAEPLVRLLIAAGVEPIGHDDGACPILAAPIAEDCTDLALRLGIDHKRLVAVDLAMPDATRLTLMQAPGADPTSAAGVAALFARIGRETTVIRDSPGFIGPRIVAMIANLGCAMAEMGLAGPADIDLALQLGLNYPAGPFALADRLGAGTVHEILTQLRTVTGSDRYRPTPWLRRRAKLGLSAATPA
ncbi:MAG TPA: 3-hydroxyacyl-CoA dehydrogenase [Stellaceae bacterium]|nr:3-hydroxyacyl-CoA dehydrogenase [Stellaceae bacterium]